MDQLNQQLLREDKVVQQNTIPKKAYKKADLIEYGNVVELTLANNGGSLCDNGCQNSNPMKGTKAS
jgi:hypothetical protein